ncbi:MAG: hypothetical protein PHN78_09020 [Dehalococcoidales bacterium]|nr:hypothetical protein [Dehalococcoidales bacterium]
MRIRKPLLYPPELQGHTTSLIIADVDKKEQRRRRLGVVVSTQPGEVIIHPGNTVYIISEHRRCRFPA